MKEFYARSSCIYFSTLNFFTRRYQFPLVLLLNLSSTFNHYALNIFHSDRLNFEIRRTRLTMDFHNYFANDIAEYNSINTNQIKICKWDNFVSLVCFRFRFLYFSHQIQFNEIINIRRSSSFIHSLFAALRFFRKMY